MTIYATSLRELIEQLEQELVDTYNECNEHDPDHKPAKDVRDYRVYYHMAQRDYASDWHLYQQLVYAEQAMAACEHMPLGRLRAMNATGEGTLTTAYDVCSVLREALSDNADLRLQYENNPIEWGLEIGEVVMELKPQIDAVVAWALTDPEATDVLHPQETAS